MSRALPRKESPAIPPLAFLPVGHRRAVEATAEQILELAATPGIHAVRPNRRLRNIAS
jgi:hypothetical protein